jgi:hypothetical protein
LFPFPSFHVRSCYCSCSHRSLFLFFFRSSFFHCSFLSSIPFPSFNVRSCSIFFPFSSFHVRSSFWFCFPSFHVLSCYCSCSHRSLLVLLFRFSSFNVRSCP